MREIGPNIKLFREQSGFNQSQISSAIKINRVQYTNFENGKFDLTLDKLNLISDLLGVNIDLFFDENPQLNAEFISAFRNKDINEEDILQLASFQRFVKNYLKIQRISANG